ncbi:MAG: hypothetical protein CUN56_06290 [Phototrophicales bacterium]|nr:MAG: hypothetical protein CUN56_06290 [Phototrophicales bacterium]RMG72631.1 MAG: FHA domain-containing protein [Chloroflexota bacterium]
MARLCVNCGYENRVGIVFCENCGEPIEIDMRQPVSSTRGISQSLVEHIDDDPADTVRVDVDAVVQREGTSVFDKHMMLRLEVDGLPEGLLFRPYEGRDMILGRRDPQANYIPDIDLMPYGGYSMGISRRHAVLHLSGKRLTIRDLGSSNGTFINGTQLDSKEAHQLRDGDRLRLGNMVFTVYFDDSQL